MPDPISSRLLHTWAPRLTALPYAAKKAIMMSADAVILVGSMALTVGVCTRTLFPITGVHGLLLILAPLIGLPMLVMNRVYPAMVRFPTVDGLARTVRAQLGSAVALGLTIAVLGFLPAVWNLIVFYFVVTIFALTSMRYSAAVALRIDERRQFADRVVIYGAGQTGRQLAAALSTTGKFRPVAFVDDRADLVGRSVHGLRIHAPDELERLKNGRGFDRVLLAIPSVSARRRAAIVALLEPLAVKVMVMPGFNELASGTVRIDDLRDIQVEDLLGRESVKPDRQLLEALIRDRAVMVTGAGGSIGSELCRQILLCGVRRLVLFEMSEFALYAIERELRALIVASASEIELIPVLGSVLDRDALRRVLAENRIDTVYHAAAYKHVPLVEQNMRSAVRNNVLGTLNVAELIVEAGVANFVLISSDKAVRPCSVMGATKRIQELILQALAERHPGLRATMVRFGNVLASSGSVVPVFREQIQRGGPVTVTHAEVTRYFMTIREAAQLVIQAGALGQHGEVFVLDMGEPVKIVDLARKMIHLAGLSLRDAANPDGDVEIKFTGLRPGEKLYEELLIDDSTAPTRHPMIRQARECFLGWGELNQQLAALIRALEAPDSRAVRKVLADLVHGYQPPGLFEAPARTGFRKHYPQGAATTLESGARITSIHSKRPRESINEDALTVPIARAAESATPKAL